MTPWGVSSSARDESGVCLCVLVRIVHWVVLRVRCKVNMGVTLYTFEVPLGTPMKKVGTSGTPMLEALLKV